MKKFTAYILLVLFSTFLGTTTVDFGRYLKMLNAGASTEDVSSLPEEQKEDSQKLKKHLQASEYGASLSLFNESESNEIHHFPISENIYFEVPHSPPDFV